MAQQEKISEWFEDHIPIEVLNSELLQMKISLPTKFGENGTVVDRHQHVVSIPSYVTLSEHDAEKQLAQTPAQYAWVSAVYAALKKNAEIIELAIKKVRAVKYKEVLERLQEKGIKPTDTQVKTILEGDEAVQNLGQSLSFVQSQLGRTYGLLKAIEMKHESARSLNKSKQQEYFNS